MTYTTFLISFMWTTTAVLQLVMAVYSSIWKLWTILKKKKGAKIEPTTVMKLEVLHSQCQHQWEMQDAAIGLPWIEPNWKDKSEFCRQRGDCDEAEWRWQMVQVRGTNNDGLGRVFVCLKKSNNWQQLCWKRAEMLQKGTHPRLLLITGRIVVTAISWTMSKKHNLSNSAFRNFLACARTPW